MKTKLFSSSWENCSQWLRHLVPAPPLSPCYDAADKLHKFSALPDVLVPLAGANGAGAWSRHHCVDDRRAEIGKQEFTGASGAGTCSRHNCIDNRRTEIGKHL